MNIIFRRVVSHQLRSGLPLMFVALIVSTFLFMPASAAQGQSGDIGYRDFTYPSGAGGDSHVTGEKPESKLWWTDGSWFGCMWSKAGNAYHIYRLNTATQIWTDTGVAIDDRLGSKADALWDGSNLYIVSHLFITSTSTDDLGELYRYSYNASSKTFSPDTGYPVVVTGGKSETLVIEKDSGGQLWVTYTQNNRVMINHSNGADNLWGTPYPLPAGGAENVASDDISSLITYKQYVGVMWSNQKTIPFRMNFAVHSDGDSDKAWNTISAYSVSGDDHINLKSLESDSAGNVFAVIKTNRSAALIVVMVCKNTVNACTSVSDWTPHTVYNSLTYNPTRPLMLIDETNRHLYVFTRNDDAGGNGNGIYYKRANLDNISFPTGIGTPFIRNAVDDQVNDVTSTKQNLNASTGLVILASDQSSKYYMHNFLALENTQPNSHPNISSFSPTSGTVGTEVSVTGSNLNNVTQVVFNGKPAANFTHVSDTLLRALVPSGASSGLISVTTPAETISSTQSFTVTSAPLPPQITSFDPPNGPTGTMVTLSGSNLRGTIAVTFNNIPAQSFTILSNTKITAVVADGVTSGPITVNSPAGPATSSTSFLVTQTDVPITTRIYLSLILQSMKP